MPISGPSSSGLLYHFFSGVLYNGVDNRNFVKKAPQSGWFTTGGFFLCKQGRSMVFLSSESTVLGAAMMYYSLITEASRKAKSVKNIYEALKHSRKHDIKELTPIADFIVSEGVTVPPGDVKRVLQLHLQDEHLSPYMKSNMSLFHFLMLDESAKVSMYRTELGWLMVFDNIQIIPRPFGNQGHDMR